MINNINNSFIIFVLKIFLEPILPGNMAFLSINMHRTHVKEQLAIAFEHGNEGVK